MVVVAVVACIFLLKLVLSQNKALVWNGIETASIIASLANAVQIQVSLTEWLFFILMIIMSLL